MEQQVHENRGALVRLDDAIAWAEAAVVGLSMVVMAANTIANVLGRYVFAQSIYFPKS